MHDNLSRVIPNTMREFHTNTRVFHGPMEAIANALSMVLIHSET